MLTQQQLIAYLEGQLGPAERAEIERLLQEDPEAQLTLADQQNLDLALRVLLGPAEHQERVKQSIFTVLRGASSEAMASAVMKETRAVSTPARGRLTRFVRLLGLKWRAPAAPSAARSAKAESSLLPGSRFWVPACALVLLVGAWLVFFLPPSRERFVVGHFTAVVGEPILQQGAERPGSKPQVRSSVRWGDRIETGDADKAELVFKDGTTLRLGFNTVVTFPVPARGSGQGGSPMLRPPQIDLLRGQVWTKVQKLTNAPPYAIRTEAATATARGTEFGVKIQKPTSTDASVPITVLTVKEGAVDFSNSFGSVQATAMTESTASADGAPTQPVVLRTLKTFDLAPGKQIDFASMSAVFDLNTFMYQMVYPLGWAGFDVRTIQESGNDSGRRLQVVRVWPGSPADGAGLAVGDVITRVNGQSVTNIHEVLRPVFRQRGSAVTLDVLHGGLPRTASLVTTRHPYALSDEEMSAEAAAIALDASWSLIETGFQGAISSNQWRQLDEEFQTLLGRYPKAAALHNNLAVWYEGNGQVGPAIQHLNQAIAAAPDNPLYHYNLSEALATIGNFERCVEEAEKVVELAPAWVPGLVEVAQAYSLLSRYDDALRVLEAALEANPAEPKLWETKGFLLVTGRRPQEALAAVTKAIELEPSNAQWWFLLGVIHDTLGDSAKAEAAGRKAVELDPGFAEAHQALAIDIISRLPGRLPGDVTVASPEELAVERWRVRPAEELAILEEAERYARRAIELKPDAAANYKDLGQILLLRGAVDDAERVLRQGMQIDPEGRAAADACNALAYYFAIWGIRLDEALQLAQQAAQKYPAGHIFDTLAVVHFRRGEWDQAEEAWKKCIELNREDPDVWFHLGKVFERKNQPASATAAYQEALRLRPDFPEASRALSPLTK